MSIVERGTINIDPYAARTSDGVSYRGHSFSDANPGMALIAVPAWTGVYALYRHLPSRSPLRSEAVHFCLAHFCGCAVTSAAAGAFTGVMLALFVYSRTGSGRRAVFTAVLYSIGSITFFFSTRMNQNVVVAALIFAIYTLIFAPAALKVFEERVRLPLIGLLAGVAVLVDLPSIPMLVVLVAYCIARAPDRRLLGVGILVGSFPLLILMAYLFAAFQNPLSPPQAHFAPGINEIHKMGLFGVVLPNPRYVLAMLISPDVGLFAYMPYSLLSVWFLMTRRGSHNLIGQHERVAIIILSTLHLVFISSTLVFQTEFGPRYLLPCIPLLCLVFGIYMPFNFSSAWSGRKTQFAVLLTALSLFFNIAGAQIGVITANLYFILAIWLLRGPWLPITDWIKLNIQATAHLHPAVLTPYGLLLALMCTVAAIWLPYFAARITIAHEESVAGSSASTD